MQIVLNIIGIITAFGMLSKIFSNISVNDCTVTSMFITLRVVSLRYSFYVDVSKSKILNKIEHLMSYYVNQIENPLIILNCAQIFDLFVYNYLFSILSYVIVVFKKI
jgi:hypothetical protein